MDERQRDAFVEEVVSTINGSYRMDLDEYGRKSWADYVREVTVTQRDAAMVSIGMWDLIKHQPQRPTIADFRKWIHKARSDNPLDREEEKQETEEAYGIPDWAKGKILALVAKDYRAWPEQERGYADLHREHGGEAYLWPKQEMMPAEEIALYTDRGRGLSPTMIRAALAGAFEFQSPGKTPESDSVKQLLGGP